MTKTATSSKTIKSEIKRLTALFEQKQIDPEKLQIVQDLINDIAFMTSKTKMLKDEIDTYGCTEIYQNGENQTGRKKSAAVDVYLNMTKQKAALIKQLTDLLPDDTAVVKKDEFDEFAGIRNRKNRK